MDKKGHYITHVIAEKFNFQHFYREVIFFDTVLGSVRLVLAKR